MALCSCKVKFLSLLQYSRSLNPELSYRTRLQMSAIEVILVVASAAQPLCVGAVAYLGFIRTLSRSSLSSTISSRRDRLSSFRFYECATYSRLTSSFVYPLSFTSVLCAYVVYDVDLALFLCEVLLLADAGSMECFVCCVLLALTAAGLCYDYKVTGYGWELR